LDTPGKNCCIKGKDITPPEEIGPIQKKMDLILSGAEDSARFEKRYIHKNNSLVWADVSVALKRDTEGKPLFFITTVVDITRQKKAEEEKKESQMLYQALVEQASDAFFVHDFEGKFVDVNRQACESLGYSKEELLTMSVTDVEQDFDLKSAQSEWAKTAPGTRFTLYGHQKRKDGSGFSCRGAFRMFCMEKTKSIPGSRA
jgi:PAS domain S-box-containing protein